MSFLSKAVHWTLQTTSPHNYRITAATQVDTHFCSGYDPQRSIKHDEKINSNIPKSQFLGQLGELHTAQSTNKSYNKRVMLIRHPCDFKRQFCKPIYTNEIQLPHFYNAMLLKGKVLSTEQNILSGEKLYGSV